MTPFHEKNWKKTELRKIFNQDCCKNLKDINNETFLDSRIKILVKCKRLQQM